MKPKSMLPDGWSPVADGGSRRAGEYTLMAYWHDSAASFTWAVWRRPARPRRGRDLIADGHKRTLAAACKAAEKWVERRAWAVLRGLGRDESERECAVTACAQGLRLQALMIEHCTDSRQPWYRTPEVRAAIVAELRAAANAVSPEGAVIP